MRTFIFFIGCFLMQISAIAQNVEVKSFVDKNKVTVNEIITFSITTNSNCQIRTPNFGDLSIVQGPFSSSSSRIININGQRSVEQELKYTYRLRAPKTGKFKIASVNLICGGKDYSTKPIVIEAIEGNTSALGQSSNIPSNNSDFFMRMYSNKSTVYEGEPFTISLKIFSKSQPQNIENLEFGDSQGLLRKDLNPNQSSFNSQIEVINGIRYFTTTIRSELCYAQNSGQIEIKPGYISAIFRRGIFSQERKEAKSNNLTINVKPLPNGAPKNFNGLVGSIKLDHSVSKTVLKPGEAIDLQVVISGSGNLNTFDDPNFSFPNDFEQFDPEINNKLSYKSSGISGKITYNYVLIPTFYGNYTIPAYSFSYFDIESNSYKTLSTGDIEIEVLKTANSEAGNTGVDSNRKAIKIEETDIHHLLPIDHTTIKTNDFVITKVWYYGMLILPIVCVWFLLLFAKKRKSESYIKNSVLKTIYAQSLSELNNAKELAAIQKNEKAIEAVSTSLKTFLKQKNNLTNLNLNMAYISELYAKKGWTDDNLKRLKYVWNSTEMYQYAPISAEKLEDLIVEAEVLIKQISIDK